MSGTNDGQYWQELMRRAAENLSVHGSSVADFVAQRPLFTHAETLISHLLVRAEEKSPGLHTGLVRVVAEKIAATEPNYPGWLVGPVFAGRARDEFRSLPLHGASDIAALGMDRGNSQFKAATIIAELAHARVEDGSLTLEQLRETMVAEIKGKKAALTPMEADEIEEIIGLTEQAALIKQHPYAIEDLFPDAKRLLMTLELRK